MNGEDQAERTEPPPVDPESAVKLRGDPPRVMRLSRKAIGMASACGFAVIGGALIYALQPEGRKGADELYNTDGVAVADNLTGAPKDYGQVPKLGPPLPGDLGKPILDAQRRGDIAALPPIGPGPPSAPTDPAATAAEAARQRSEQEREAARGSRLFFGGGSRNLLATLRERDLADAGVSISREHNLPYHQGRPSGEVSGDYRKRVQLASGRFAMIDDGLGFSLVPWSKQLDRHLGQYVSGTARSGGGIEWTLGRSRSIEI